MLDINDILAGNQNAGAGMIRLIEDRDPLAHTLLKRLYPHAGRAFIIGITGSPGVGKSSLIDGLIAEFRGLDKRVAVIACDPSSPVTGGAILGDRLRMQRHAADEGVFIRSMASRGEKGGLSRAAKDAVLVLDAMGYPIIIIETAGAGQTEVDVAGLAHSVGIVTIPGAGDGIQAIKAGILETGDVFIVNKSDRPDSEAAVFELNMMLGLRPPSLDGWKPFVLQTQALNGTGVKELARVFLSHFDFLRQEGRLEKKQIKMESRYFQSLVRDLALEKIMAALETSEGFQDAFKKIRLREIDPVTAAESVMDNIRVLNNDTKYHC
ncbi:MAG: methylmalonyl Co-A mutase-associated GTPase MeaB [Desulfobacteraceae bacterium]|nr:methylmalonyl Co-A mutase-associated GTPase MeaB [Desulfobacteraceae bacterium]